MKLFRRILWIIFFWIVTTISTFPQNSVDFHSPSSIKLFGDFLFCEKDYLRAAIEYEKYLNFIPDDSIKFKIGLSYSKIGEYKRAAEIFSSVNLQPAKNEYYKAVFQQEDYYSFRDLASNKNIPLNNSPVSKLYYYSYFFTNDSLPNFNELSSLFDSEEELSIKKFYEWKKDPPYKSPLTAAILSAVIPGSGKFYIGEIGDGIAALISTGAFGYLSYSNFNAGHKFRGWLFAGISALFYSGNIYGSAAAAQIYNAGVQFNFNNELKFYLEQKNYFIPEYNFYK